ncbi:MAG TPA: hypothetical protein VIN59_06670 [Alphaproteobacteria bacterium]
MKLSQIATIAAAGGIAALLSACSTTNTIGVIEGSGAQPKQQTQTQALPSIRGKVNVPTTQPKSNVGVITGNKI